MNFFLHWFLKSWFKATAIVYYAKVTILNLKKVPLKQPLLLVINHSNAFWDPTLVGSFTYQRIWYLARGDVFKNKKIAFVLNMLGMAPIYRMREGMENLDKNKESFNKCFSLFSHNETVAMFAEGDCVRESKLRPLKKGVARIAHGTLEHLKYTPNFKVVCVGINYDDPDNLNSKLIINYSNAITVADYFQKGASLDAKSAHRFIKDIEHQLDGVMFNIHQRERHKIFHFIQRNFWGLISRNSKNEQISFDRVKKFSDKINDLSDDLWNTLTYEVEAYSIKLKQYNTREKYVNNFLISRKYLEPYFITLILFVPAIPGLLLNSWPYFISQKIAQKIVREKEFYSSINIAGASFMYMLWYIILFFVLLFYFPAIKVILLIVSLHFSGIIALHFASYMRSIKGQLNILKLKPTEKSVLLDSRNQCINAIEKLIQL